ncbi:M14 metallopeptidase family protein [Ascidiimonas sp. W6]|uniref:M14 family metallopeptidase n=1 Tax=Ascidiimonas meishanensis TaxID=3128903 RepID=UPI0030EB3D71
MFLIINNPMEHSLFKQQKLTGRYIAPSHINTLLDKLPKQFERTQIGSSVNGHPIEKIKIGTGKKRILMWSQMHGNESTTTKAVFDLLNFLESESELSDSILSNCELHIIPMLNPDGSEAYTRVNANKVDINRDAQELSQPESVALREAFNEINPNFCFNLHGQRTIFNTKGTVKPATVSFLSPSANLEKTITPARKKAMELIVVMNEALQLIIPGQIGRYDDGFNINCVGDTFQSLGAPTILFEAGHYPEDYVREKTRVFIWKALLVVLDYISNHENGVDKTEAYFDIPENEKRFFDIIIENVTVLEKNKTTKKDIAVQYKEVLAKNQVIFVPEIRGIGSYKNHLAHQKLNYIDYQKDAIYVNDLDNSWIFEFLKNYH